MTLPPPIDLTAVLMTALLNPAVIVVAFWMGRYADQRHKIPVAAFAAALAGSVVVYIAVRLGMTGLGACRTRRSGRVHRPVPGGARVGVSGLPAVSEMTSARSLLRIWLWATVVGAGGAAGVGVRAGAGVPCAADAGDRAAVGADDRPRAQPAEDAGAPSPCVEAGIAFDANEGGGRCVRDLGGDLGPPSTLDRRLSRWTHWVGVSRRLRRHHPHQERHRT